MSLQFSVKLYRCVILNKYVDDETYIFFWVSTPQVEFHGALWSLIWCSTSIVSFMSSGTNMIKVCISEQYLVQEVYLLVVILTDVFPPRLSTLSLLCSSFEVCFLIQTNREYIIVFFNSFRLIFIPMNICMWINDARRLWKRKITTSQQ